MSKTGFVKEIKRSYPVFDAVDDDGRIFPREPAKECWNSHCSSFGEKKDFFWQIWQTNSKFWQIIEMILLSKRALFVNFCFPNKQQHEIPSLKCLLSLTWPS